MASGFGNNTVLGRCYPIFMEFKECSMTEGGSACHDLREDYLECLHHKKESTRFNTMEAERARKLKAGDSLPPTIHEQEKQGSLKTPWTNAK